jgi:NADH-quinone oxidoreductase subunit A
MTNQISEFGIALLFILGGIFFVIMGLFTSSLLRPSRPNPEKLSTYECGEESMGNTWGKFNIKFYAIGLIFVLFEVELVLLFPWAVVFGNKTIQKATNGLWGMVAITEAFVFIGMLAFGLAYIWAKGHLEWLKSENLPKNEVKSLPKNLYEKLL